MGTIQKLLVWSAQPFSATPLGHSSWFQALLIHRSPGTTVRPHLRFPTPRLGRKSRWIVSKANTGILVLFSDTCQVLSRHTPQGATSADQYLFGMWQTATKVNLIIWSFQGSFHMVNKWAGKIPCSAQITDTCWKVRSSMPKWKSQNDS